MDARGIPIKKEMVVDEIKCEEKFYREVEVVVDLALPDWLQHVCMLTSNPVAGGMMMLR